jgi:hypothetical protein
MINAAISMSCEAKPLDAFTSIGCYPLLYLTKNNDCLCAACATEVQKQGEQVRGDVYWEGEPIDCDECGEPIESAYGAIKS